MVLEEESGYMKLVMEKLEQLRTTEFHKFGEQNRLLEILIDLLK